MLVIIHGWSDTKDSFKRLAKRLDQEGVNTPIKHIRLGNYITLDDDVTYDDITAALHKAWADAKLPTQPRSIDAVVHSTGALVIRHWMTTHYQPDTNPIHRLVMLAPANFGSPLAHKGRSFVGRIFKGFKSNKPFQTGTHILKGLELASPFTRDLAFRDRFTTPAKRWYGPGRVLCTVVVGNSGYSGIAAAANEDGSDGTVRVSTANLTPAHINFDFATDPYNPPPPSITNPTPQAPVAFARINRENHSTAALKDNGPRDARTIDTIRRALTVTDATFEAHTQHLDALTQAQRDEGSSSAFTHAYQDTIVTLTDDEGRPIPDFYFEAFVKNTAETKPDNKLTAYLQEEVLCKVHAYSGDPSRRSLLFNITRLHAFVKAHDRPIFFSVTASPDIRKTKTVGYSTFGYNDIGSIRLDPKDITRIFQPDRTLFVDIRIRRMRTDDVFRFHNA